MAHQLGMSIHLLCACMQAFHSCTVSVGAQHRRFHVCGRVLQAPNKQNMRIRTGYITHTASHALAMQYAVATEYIVVPFCMHCKAIHRTVQSICVLLLGITERCIRDAHAEVAVGAILRAVCPERHSQFQPFHIAQLGHQNIVRVRLVSGC